MNILDYNHCQGNLCECGWNILLGGTSEVELMKLKNFLKENNLIQKDNTDYSEKLSTKQF